MAYADPDQLVTPGAGAARDARSKLIAANATQWESDKSAGSAKCSTYVGVALKDDGHKALTTAEVAEIDGKDGA